MFKGSHFPQEVILETIRYDHAYKLSYRETKEIRLVRGAHDTINRWVVKYTENEWTPTLKGNQEEKIMEGLKNIHSFFY